MINLEIFHGVDLGKHFREQRSQLRYVPLTIAKS